MAQIATENISMGDWKATPKSVRDALLSLEEQRNALLKRLELNREATGEMDIFRVKRYHELVEQQFLSGLTPEQRQEIDLLAEEIDSKNAGLYPSICSLSETLTNENKKYSTSADRS